jgi:hypothetical protein
MKFIAALNSINSQVWAFLVILSGGGFVLMFHRSGIDVGIAAGVMGAGVQMFTSSNKGTPDHPTVPPIDAVAVPVKEASE